MMTLSTIACAALLGLPSFSGSPVAAPAQDAARVDETDSTDEGAMRLLRMRDGSVLRTRARSTEKGWELREGNDGWTPLPAGSVLHATLERDALADARRLEQAVSAVPRKEQDTRRVALADWMTQQGLVAEALVQLDRVLANDPDQRQALALIGSLAPRLDVAAMDAAMQSVEPTIGVLRTAANATPTLREVAIQRLASQGATEELRADLRAQLSSHSPRLRALAALALRRIFAPNNLKLDELRPLILRSVLDGSEEVRCEAARALRDVQDPQVAVSALRALDSTNARLRENSIQALGVMGYPAAVEPLIGYLGRLNAAAQSGRSGGGVAGGSIFIGKQTAYIQDFDVEVATASAVADPQINVLTEGSVLDARVMGVYTISFVTEARLVRSALGDLTGAKLANTNRAWLEWWEANKVSWKTPQPQTTGATTAAPASKDR